MALFDVRMPANAAMFFGFLMQIASFDFIPMDLLYEIIFPNKIESEPLSANFDQIGLSSKYFLYNLGSMILVFAMIPIKILLYFVLKPLNHFKRVRKIRRNLWRSTFWNVTIATIKESFTVVVICVLINLRELKFDDVNQTVNSILTLAFGFTFLCFPVVAVILLLVKFDKLQTEYV